MKNKKMTALIMITAILFTGQIYVSAADLLPTEDVTEYTRPDHWYTALEDYSGNIAYDLAYCGDNSTAYQKLHLVMPDKEEGPYPVLVFVHGGGWSGLNSEDHTVAYTAEGALRALDYGYAVALVDYSVLDDTNKTAMPNQIYEVKAAIRYLRSIADEYKLDSEKIAVMGESAGGHLVDIVGTTNGEANYDIEEYGNMDFSSDVQAVIAQYSVGKMDENLVSWLYGVDTEEMKEEELQALIVESSAVCHADENDPPFYIEAGLQDSEVAYTQSCDLYNALMMAGDDEYTELHLYPGMDHAVTWFQSEEDAKGYMTWLDKVFGR